MVYFRAMQGGWQPPPQYGAHDPRQQPPSGYDTYGTYEFNPLENGIIGKCAGRAKLLGWISIVAGAFQLLGGGCGAIASPYYAMYVPYGIVSLIVGFTFIGVGNSLQSIVDALCSEVDKLGQHTPPGIRGQSISTAAQHPSKIPALPGESEQQPWHEPKPPRGGEVDHYQHAVS